MMPTPIPSAPILKPSSFSTFRTPAFSIMLFYFCFSRLCLVTIINHIIPFINKLKLGRSGGRILLGLSPVNHSSVWLACGLRRSPNGLTPFTPPHLRFISYLSPSCYLSVQGLFLKLLLSYTPLPHLQILLML